MCCLKVITLIVVMIHIVSTSVAATDKPFVLNVSGGGYNNGNIQNNIATGVQGSVVNMQNGVSSSSTSGNGYYTSVVNGVTTGWCQHKENGKSAIIYFSLKNDTLKVLDIDGDLEGDSMDALVICKERAENASKNLLMKSAWILEDVNDSTDNATYQLEDMVTSSENATNEDSHMILSSAQDSTKNKENVGYNLEKQKDTIKKNMEVLMNEMQVNFAELIG